MSLLALCLLPQALAELTNYSILRSFGLSDDGPSRLIEGDDRALYGTTMGGGPSGFGTVFKLNKNGTSYTVLHRFTVSRNFDGVTPQGQLTRGSDLFLYGTTRSGGTNLSGSFGGTVFKLSHDGSAFAILRRFTGIDGDGQEPTAGVVEARDGSLYGTTVLGGTNDCGTVFKLNRDGSGYMVLRRFTGVGGDGQEPSAGLIEGSEGALYGTTALGGVSQFGTIFKLNKDGSGYTVLHRFTASSGSSPTAELLEGSNGTLYGTTELGGGNNDGTVFKLDKNGTGYAVLHSFDDTDGDGEGPSASLIEGSDGSLYGTTWRGGGTNAGGTVFKLNKDGTGYEVLHRFTGIGEDGRNPFETLLKGSDGALYGTTLGGGILAHGTIFRLGHALSLSRLQDRVALGLAGIPGFTYQLNRSTDLMTWTTLKAVIIPVNATATHDDTNAPPGAAFYRLHAP